MKHFILAIIVILVAIYVIDPNTFNHLKDGAGSVLGLKTQQIKNDVTDLKTISLNGTNFISVGEITRECTTDSECKSYNKQCDASCVCTNGICYKPIN